MTERVVVRYDSVTGLWDKGFKGVLESTWQCLAFPWQLGQL